MIFAQGVFHTDPHPGNLLRLPDGGCGLLDFGQCKRLHPTDLAALAMLTCALAARDQAGALAAAAAAGLVVEGVPPDFEAAVVYVLFDTRMDIPEAHMSPFDVDTPEVRDVRVRTIPEGLFMVARALPRPREPAPALAPAPTCTPARQSHPGARDRCE